MSETVPLVPAVAAEPTVQLSLFQRIYRIKEVLIVMLMVGFVSGVPSAYEPDLQMEAFGNNMYIQSGSISVAKGVVCAVFNSIISSMSDRKGRKGALLLSMTMTVIPYAVFVATNDYWSYTIVDIFFGMYAAALCMSMGYVTDRIPRETGKRTEGFSMLVGAMFIGLGAGPFSNYIMTQTQTFVFALCLQVGIVLFVVLFVQDDSPEAIRIRAMLKAQKQQQKKLKQCAANTSATDSSVVDNNNDKCPHCAGGAAVILSVGNTVEFPAADEDEDDDKPNPFVRLYSHCRAEAKASWEACLRLYAVLRRCPPLWVLVVMVFFNYMSVQVLEAFMNLYLSGEPMNFTPNQQTYSIVAVAVAGVICLFFVTGLMKRYLGLLNALRVGLAANALQVGLFTAVRTPLEAYLVPALGIFGQAAYPCASAIAVSLVREADAGAAIGIASLARQLAEAVSPLAFGAVFNATENDVAPMSGIGFVGAAAGVVVAFLLSFLLPRDSTTSETTQHPDDVADVVVPREGENNADATINNDGDCTVIA